MTHLTVNGRLSVRKTVYWSAENGTVVPTDTWLGLTEHRVSPGVREMCCREALDCLFEVARDNLQRTAQLSLSGRCVREIVEREGRAVQTAQHKRALPPAFDATDCTAPPLITGAHGVMVPMVTEEQKRKRRVTESAKPITQRRSSTASVGCPKQGHDGPYQEFNTVAFHDPDKSHLEVVGPGDDCEAAGRLMRREARRLGLSQTKVKYSVSDGAECISRQYRQRLPMRDVQILDYYRLLEHVVGVGQTLYGGARTRPSPGRRR